MAKKWNAGYGRNWPREVGNQINMANVGLGIGTAGPSGAKAKSMKLGPEKSIRQRVRHKQKAEVLTE